MNARLSPRRLVSRVWIASALAALALGASACNGRASTTAPTAEAPAAAVEAQAASPATPSASHGPGHWMFRQVRALDLRADQRASVEDIEANLRADLAPHKETLRQLAGVLADGIETGRLDPKDAAAQQAALEAAILDTKAAFASAMNATHDALDAGQRADLVARLEAQHHGRPVAGDAESQQPHGPIAKLAFELGLSEEQKASLREAVQQGLDEVFPNRKERREESEARMKAMADAFVSDDFDAADHDLWSGAEQSIASFAEVATRAVDVSERVLSFSQRQALASVVRERAEKL